MIVDRTILAHAAAGVLKLSAGHMEQVIHELLALRNTARMVEPHTVKRKEIGGRLVHLATCDAFTDDGCALCAKYRAGLEGDAEDLLTCLDTAIVGQAEALTKLASAESVIEKKDSEIAEAELGRDRASGKLEDALMAAPDDDALIDWALRAGAVVNDLRASPETYELARVAQLDRGGPACDSYEAKGKLDLCRCGRPFREHSRELQGA